MSPYTAASVTANGGRGNPYLASGDTAAYNSVSIAYETLMETYGGI